MQGRAEAMVGAAIRKLRLKRSDLVLATKIFWGGRGPNDFGLSRKHIVEGLQASLQRLQVSARGGAGEALTGGYEGGRSGRTDGAQLQKGGLRGRGVLPHPGLRHPHRGDGAGVSVHWIAVPESGRSRGGTDAGCRMNHVIDVKGWAFYWGTSGWTAEQIEEAWAIARRLGLMGPIAEQPQYNMLEREQVDAVPAPLQKELGLGIMVASPLKGGVLSGKYSQGQLPKGSRLALPEYRNLAQLQLGEKRAEIDKVDVLRP